MLKKIYTYIVSIIDVLFPKRQHLQVVETLPETEVYLLPKPERQSDSHTYSLYTYKDPQVRAIIWELKYHGNTRLLSTIGRMLYEEMIQTASDIILFDRNARFALIPIPIHTQTRRERGYNQCEYIARAIIEHDTTHTLLYAPQWLEKTHNTPKQSRLEHKQDRLQNLINAYTAKKDVAGYYVFLVDDVTTTGATLSVASDMLYTAGAKKVYCFTIAH